MSTQTAADTGGTPTSMLGDLFEGISVVKGASVCGFLFRFDSGC
jgi:hypothetical protein